MKTKKPLYRKVNSKARNVHHYSGGDARHDRNTKAGLKKTLKKDVHRGLDYTPLYKFLLSKIGEDWDLVHSEAVSRLDNEDAIYHLVVEDKQQKYPYRLCGESSYYSKLYVDDNNKLQVLNPNFTNEMLHPTCHCCTFTFNGKPFVNKYNPNYVRNEKE